MQAGDVITFQRTFTVEDVRTFSALSGDRGVHHVQPDERGRLVVQGLLTATLPTKVGGDHNVLARTMNFEFLRPVYTGDTVRCDVKIERYEPREDGRIAIAASFVCTKQEEQVVLKGDFAGVILR